MSDAPVLARKQGRAGRLSLNRPKALHALNLEMCELIIAALLEWKDDPDIEFILVDHAANTRGFCAGGDVLMLARSGQSDGKEGAKFFATEYRLNTLIHEYPKPYVAIIDGITMGGGVGISVHGSHRIATERSVFAMPESGIGLLPDVGGGYFLPRLDGELGMWLALTGERLKGKDVLAAGVATHYIESGEIANLISRLTKQGIVALEPLTSAAKGAFEKQRQTMDEVFSGADVEGIVYDLQNGTEWARAQAEILSTKSPLTLKVTLKQLRLGASLDFRSVMQMEYRLASRMICTPNFQEGVRSVLIDRDNAPQWQPETLAAVSPGLLDTLFDSSDSNELSFLEV